MELGIAAVTRDCWDISGGLRISHSSNLGGCEIVALNLGLGVGKEFEADDSLFEIEIDLVQLYKCFTDT